ncbi:uncharacterized protein J4E88_003128 [Alternaria novae-zelandiae]|uniref:uncharacterized protein n=1 Tax=Alternaria novae-zelandiae TaxID=430562 RepID=UPI0020C2D80B|nr:uncharacterized protein J4E88_003128 [Alternaria novae-zelandiae]KAI4687538.1 hypothetical protein J4E88_003128 [Alternaria novae-zelandiae]
MERTRLRKLRRVRTAEWIGGLGEGHAEGERKEGGRGGAGEKEEKEEGGEEEKVDVGDGEEKLEEGGEEEKADVGDGEEMETHEEAESDSETSSETVKEKVWKGKERAVEQDSEGSCSSCLEAQGKIEEQEGDVLKECKREQNDEDDDEDNDEGDDEDDDEDNDELSQTGSDKDPEWVKSWKQVVMASRAQVGSPAHRAAEQRLSGTRLSYRSEDQIKALRPRSH